MSRSRCWATSSRPRLAVGDVRVVSGDPAGRLVAAELGATLVDDPEEGQGAAVVAGLAGVDGLCLVVNADVPRVRPSDLSALAVPARLGAVAIVEARDGTTNALGLPYAEVFQPLYGPRSAAQFRAHAVALALPFEDLTLKNLVEDVDTIADLERVGMRSGSRTRALARSDLAMRVTCLSGGVGGAKLARGLQDALAPGELTVVGNVGDDVEVLGLHVSPDLDSILYALAGPQRRGARLGAGRRELAHARVGRPPGAARTGSGSATSISASISSARRHSGVASASRRDGAARAAGGRRDASPAGDRRPAANDASSPRPVASRSRSGSSSVGTRTRSTQSTSVTRPTPSPRPGVIDAIETADLLVFAPSNPYVSLGPILEVPGIRAALSARRARCVAVSPLIGGRAVKGPLDRMLLRMAGGTSPAHVAGCYEGLIDVLVIDAPTRPPRRRCRSSSRTR